jgi:predicted metal-binding membrane protein
VHASVAARVSHLPRRLSVTIVVALLVCAAAAWLITIRQASSMDMGGMAMLSAGVFLVTWLVMMVAMMFPTIAPITLAFAGVTRARGEGILSIASFVIGYLIVWTAVGLVPLVVLEGFSQMWIPTPSWLPRLGGAVVVLAGVYQFTPLKNACLRSCRSPLGFILTHDFGGGSAAAVRAGAAHGLWCLGCCWALMAVLGVIGLMNLVWMAVIAAVFFIEKNVRFGDVAPKLVGAACIIGGLAVMI